MVNAVDKFLIVAAAGLRCALPLPLVCEVMRPMPIAAVSELPPFVLGASVVRGEALPVVRLSSLLGQPDHQITRFVLVRTPGRNCVLAVGAVGLIVTLDSGIWASLPKLLSRMEVVERIAVEDQDLLVTLDAARLLDGVPRLENMRP